MFKFITGKPLWMNMSFAAVLVTVVLLLFMFSLNFLTHHGETLTIPSVTGKSFEEAKKILESRGFDVVLQDSIYNDTAAPLAVLRQFPDAEEAVKKNRTVYLTISRSVAPMVEMPLLEGLSFRNAELVLKQYGLKFGDSFYRTDFARNSVLEQYYKDERIKPGTKLPMGSIIDLILGSGIGMDEFAVPDLIGRTYEEARIILESNGLNTSIVPDSDVQDTNKAYVYQQRPERFTPDGKINRIRSGQFIDLFLSVQKPERQAVDTSGQKNDD